MKQKQTQKGNVLFLILIAVALFAALSYAVTQSSRSGGDSGRETNILNSAQLAQYPNQIRTAVLRMIIDGRDITEFEFNAPADFGDLTDTTGRLAVFHPEGGGAVYQTAPSDMMAADGGNTGGLWYYNMDFEVPDIGVTPGDTTITGNELVAFLPGVTQAVCQRINVEAGVTTALSDTVPALTPTLIGGNSGDVDNNMDDEYADPTALHTLDNATDDLAGFPFGCFRDAGGPYVYYHVINER